jgi:DCN1-like protein 1/2
MKNENTIKEVYKYTHGFATELGKRNVDIETAIEIWKLFFSGKCQFLDRWNAFMMGKLESKSLLVVTKDVWDLFYDLIK